MNNSWNRVIYKIWTPIYDKIFNSGVFLNARRQIFQDMPFHSKQKVLFVDVGTGADIELVNHSTLDITAIDFSPDMLKKAREKFKITPIIFLEMDAQNMTFNNKSFDYVVGSLILSVVPYADKCFQEMVRVLNQSGKIIIFDKFTPKDNRLSLSKKIIRPFVRVLGTDIGLNFEELYLRNNNDLRVEKDKPVMMNGMYR